jgi:hypothetical protein
MFLAALGLCYVLFRGSFVYEKDSAISEPGLCYVLGWGSHIN